MTSLSCWGDIFRFSLTKRISTQKSVSGEVSESWILPKRLITFVAEAVEERLLGRLLIWNLFSKSSLSVRLEEADSKKHHKLLANRRKQWLPDVGLSKSFLLKENSRSGCGWRQEGRVLNTRPKMLSSWGTFGLLGSFSTLAVCHSSLLFQTSEDALDRQTH